MIKVRSAIIGLLGLVSATGALAQSSVEDAVTFIRVGVTDPVTQARRELTQGSGFLIDKEGHIVTARHVVWYQELENPGPRWISVSLRDRNAAAVPAQPVKCESGVIDLCLIKIPKASVAAANIGSAFAPSCRQLQRREKIEALGYPVGSANPVLSIPGEVTGDLATEFKYPSNVQITYGMSGGPVLDVGGKVVAVNAAGGEGIPTLTFLQPLLYGEGLITLTGIDCPKASPPNPPAAPGDDSAQPLPDPITPLLHPKRLDVAASSADANVRVVRIVEGESDNPQRRLFDVMIANGSDQQVVLDSWDLEWQYHPGFLASANTGRIIEPNTRYSLELKVDPRNANAQKASVPLQPVVAMPPGSKAAPSLFHLRLEVTYSLPKEMNWHAAADWDLGFSIALRTLTGEVLPVFVDANWNS